MVSLHFLQEQNLKENNIQTIISNSQHQNDVKLSNEHKTASSKSSSNNKTNLVRGQASKV